MQDPLSVALSLTGEEREEERVKISVNEMLEEYVWSSYIYQFIIKSLDFCLDN